MIALTVLDFLKYIFSDDRTSTTLKHFDLNSEASYHDYVIRSPVVGENFAVKNLQGFSRLVVGTSSQMTWKKSNLFKRCGW